MKSSLIGILFVAIMALAFVPSAEAGVCFFSGHNSAAVSTAHSTPVCDCAGDVGPSGKVMKGTHFAWGLSGSPAYTDYTNAREVPPASYTSSVQTPYAMSAW